jgi:hypothetical protein
MDELERWLRAQDVDPCEGLRPGRGSLLVQVRQRRSVKGIGVVAQDRDRLCEPPCFRREADETNRDGARAGPSLELAQPADVPASRGQALGGDCVD